MICIIIIINKHIYKIIISKITKKIIWLFVILLVSIYMYLELYINFNVSKFKLFHKILKINDNLFIALRTSI